MWEDSADLSLYYKIMLWVRKKVRLIEAHFFLLHSITNGTRVQMASQFNWIRRLIIAKIVLMPTVISREGQ